MTPRGRAIFGTARLLGMAVVRAGAGGTTADSPSRPRAETNTAAGGGGGGGRRGAAAVVGAWGDQTLHHHDRDNSCEMFALLLTARLRGCNRRCQGRCLHGRHGSSCRP